MTKILIAEDERDIRDLITFTLGFAGFDVVAAGNGEEALNLARQEMPDLILMDVRMPRMTGYEACAAMKADREIEGYSGDFPFGQRTGCRDPDRSSGRSSGLFVETIRPRPVDGTNTGSAGQVRQVTLDEA